MERKAIAKLITRYFSDRFFETLAWVLFFIGASLAIFLSHGLAYLIWILTYIPLIVALLLARRRYRMTMSDLREAHTECVQLSQTKSHFVSLVSHEIRTPLTSVKEAIAIVDDGMAGSVTEQQRKFLGIARNNVERINKLVNDLLDLARIESGKVELNKELLNISTIIDEVSQNLKPQFVTKNITFKNELPANLPEIMADKDMMVRLLINLIGNSVKYTEENGIIYAKGKSDRKSISIIIEDNGIGMLPEDLPKVFEIYHRLDQEELERIKGSGMGLAICREIVEMHGGRIWAESEGEGKGSKFIFILPCTNTTT
ncbi:MAG: ATP-binding protein [bacterium]